MKQLYLDCQSGISGDMTLSALIDLGADIVFIKEQLKQLPIDSFTMDVVQVNKKGITAKLLNLQFDNDSGGYIDTHSHGGQDQSHDHEEHSHSHDQSHDHEGHSHTHDHSHFHEEHRQGHIHNNNAHRKASTILEMIKNSSLPARVKDRSIAVFQVIAEAEGKIHGMKPEDVHFHEVGAMDSIIDIIGVCLALESLEIDKIIASPVPTGYGKVVMAHGLYPIPAPATAEILRGVPLADFHVRGELTTPTGAGFLKALTSEYGHMPPLPMERIGYGAGKKDFDHPNVLRAVLFESSSNHYTEEITVLECQLDDMTGEMLGYVMEKVLETGALDVYFTPVIMKKSRPGTLLTVLAKPQDVSGIEELLLKETSTFGVRKSNWSRNILQRRFQKVETPYGNITVKIGYSNGEIYKMTPEYEEVKKAATIKETGFMEVYSAAQLAAKEQIIGS